MIVSSKQTAYRVDSAIGKGQFGTVYLVSDAKKRQYVIKVLHMQACNEAAMAEAKKEVDILKLNTAQGHTNIIRYYDSWFKAQKLHILMEYAPFGTLADRINDMKASKAKFTEWDVKSMTQMLLTALAVCHNTLKVIHRDIKPENILIAKYGVLKLADFGISKQIRDIQALCLTQAGTPVYMPPEMIEGRKYTVKADVWALGCVIYHIMALRPPWMSSTMRSMEDLFEVIKTSQIDTSDLRTTYSSEMCRLVHWMLSKTPDDRPTMKQALALFDMRPPPDNATNLYESASVIQMAFRQSFRSKRQMAAQAALRALENADVIKDDSTEQGNTLHDNTATSPTSQPCTKFEKEHYEIPKIAKVRDEIPKIAKPIALNDDDGDDAVKAIQRAFRMSLNRRHIKREVQKGGYMEKFDKEKEHRAPRPRRPASAAGAGVSRIDQLAIPRTSRMLPSVVNAPSVRVQQRMQPSPRYVWR